MDLRVRVLADCDAGMAPKDAAAKYTVSPAWVRRLLQRRRQTGETAPRPRRYGPRPLRETLAADPDGTLVELREALNLDVALSTLWQALDALGLTLKKSRSGRRSRTA